MKKILAVLLLLALQDLKALEDPDLNKFQAEVQSLRAPDVAWRAIPWKSCLLDGLKASRETMKPILLWVFIDRPVDDERC